MEAPVNRWVKTGEGDVVSSSWVSSFMMNSENKILVIVTHDNKHIAYKNFPEDLYEEMYREATRKGGSIGRFINKRIKKNPRIEEADTY